MKNKFKKKNFVFLADACFKAALSLIAEMPNNIYVDSKPQNSELFLIPYMKNFLSTLLVVPVSIILIISFSAFLFVKFPNFLFTTYFNEKSEIKGHTNYFYFHVS